MCRENYQPDGIVILGLGQNGIEITKYLHHHNVYFLDGEHSGLQFSKREKVILLKESPVYLDPFNVNYMMEDLNSKIEEVIKNKILFLVCGAEDEKGLYIEMACGILDNAKRNHVPAIGIIEEPSFWGKNPVTLKKLQELENKLDYSYLYKDKIFYKDNFLDSLNHLQRTAYRQEEIRVMMQKMIAMLENIMSSDLPFAFEKLEFLFCENLSDAGEKFCKIKEKLVRKRKDNSKCVMAISTADCDKRIFYEQEITKVWGRAPLFYRFKGDGNAVQLIILFY